MLTRLCSGTRSPFEYVCSPLKETTPKKVVTQEPVQEVGSSETAIAQKETPEEAASATIEDAGLSFEVALGPESVPAMPKPKMAFRNAAFRGDIYNHSSN